jgi:hypothetical protein
LLCAANLFVLARVILERSFFPDKLFRPSRERVFIPEKVNSCLGYGTLTLELAALWARITTCHTLDSSESTIDKIFNHLFRRSDFAFPHLFLLCSLACVGIVRLRGMPLKHPHNIELTCNLLIVRSNSLLEINRQMLREYARGISRHIPGKQRLESCNPRNR